MTTGTDYLGLPNATPSVNSGGTRAPIVGYKQVAGSGGPQLIVAATVNDAVRKMRGDNTARPALLVIGNDVIRAEVQVFTGNTTIAADTAYGSSTPDVLTLVRIEGTYTVNTTRTVTTTVRKLGLVIYSTGNQSITGTITMTGMGGLGPGVALKIDGSRSLSAAGANGGATAVGQAAGNNGSAGSGQQAGGGGGGGGSRAGGSGAGGAGSAGTSWSGGTGGGAAAGDANAAAIAAMNGVSPASTGQGGNGLNAGTVAVASAGGGSGNGVAPGVPGTGLASSSGAPTMAGWGPQLIGTGGLLVLLCDGDVTVNSGGIVSSNGRDGGRGGGSTENSPSYSPAMGGGATGGGIVIILRTGSYTNSGTVQANGGTGGLAGFMYHTGGNFAAAGGNGGAGTVTTGTLAA